MARAMLTSICMTHAKAWLLAGGALVAGLIACGAQSASALDGESPSGKGTVDGAGRADNAPNIGALTPTASGIILVHAARFPGIRLCFESYPEEHPQPDSKVMPEANVVGLELGSVVRLPPLERPPGKVYVMSERALRGQQVADKTCGELLTGPNALLPNSAHNEATVISEPLGTGGVHLLAITGCGGSIFLDAISAPSDRCGANWSSSAGNLIAQTVRLSATEARATYKAIPVQLVHAAPEIDAAGQKLAISFGSLSKPGALEKTLELSSLLSLSPATTLDVDQTDEAFYGTHGFRITLGAAGGGTTATIDQSLAEIQNLSAPSEIPTTYYRAASTYAMLIVGDPSVPSTVVDDAGAQRDNPDRRRLHMLTIPIVDPEQGDAGLDGGADAN